MTSLMYKQDSESLIFDKTWSEEPERLIDHLREIGFAAPAIENWKPSKVNVPSGHGYIDYEWECWTLSVFDVEANERIVEKMAKIS